MTSKNSTSSLASQRAKRRILDTEVVGDAELWVFKRKWQRRDIENVRSARCTPEQTSWLPREKAQSMRLINRSY
jgi:hypothetical protein